MIEILPTPGLLNLYVQTQPEYINARQVFDQMGDKLIKRSQLSKMLQRQSYI